MELIKKDKFFYLSLATTAILSTYLLRESYMKYLKIIKIKQKKESQDLQQDDLSCSIYKICITGGPTSGKTSAVSYLNESLTQKGFKVLLVPEITQLIKMGGGMLIQQDLNEEKLIKFQTELIKVQIALENHINELAILSSKQGKKCVILSEGGVMDPKAYLSPKIWEIIMENEQWNLIGLRDQRYDAVIHLTTGADFVSFNDNPNQNIPDVAKQIDQLLHLAWIGHPQYQVFESMQSFDDKMKKVNVAVEIFLGLPVSNSVFRKYLVNINQELINQQKFVELDVEETFLKSLKKQQIKIRKTGQNNQFSYAHFNRTQLQLNERNEKQRPITKPEYMILYENKDENFNTVYKQRLCFVWEQRHFILDIIQIKGNKIVLLETAVLSENDEVKCPPFIQMIEDVTQNVNYSTYHLARKSQ